MQNSLDTKYKNYFVDTYLWIYVHTSAQNRVCQNKV